MTNLTLKSSQKALNFLRVLEPLQQEPFDQSGVHTMQRNGAPNVPNVAATFVSLLSEPFRIREREHSLATYIHPLFYRLSKSETTHSLN